MKSFVKAMAVLSGLGLVVWPFLLFGLAFLGGPPSKGPLDMAARCGVAIAILGYPIYWNKARKAARDLLEEEASRATIALVALSPLLVLAFATMGAAAFSP